jgi:indole-3-acetate monooxygenase
MPLSEQLWKNRSLNSDWQEKIARLAPILVEAEAKGIVDRHFPIEAINAMYDEGLFSMGLAEEVGGLALDPVAEMEVYEAVARISVTAAWNIVVGNIHTGWASAFLSDAAVAEIFPAGHRTIVAGQASPTGRGVVVDGGVRVTGKYSWGSGYNQASWVMGGFVADDGQPMIFVAPKSSAVCLDNWHVVGIEGSGSYDFAVEDLFIPEGYWYPFLQAVPLRGGARFAQPFIIQSLAPHAAMSLGGAEHAIECVARLAATKKRGLATGTIADRGAFQRDLALAYTQITAAREQLVMASLDIPSVTVWQPEDIARYVSMGAMASALAVDVATTAFRYAGGNSVRLDSPLQRILRDVLVAQQHVAIADQVYDQLGVALIDASMAG